MNFFSEVEDNISLNSTHFITKIPNKQELQQIAFDHSSDIDFKDLRARKFYFLKYKNYFRDGFF